MEGIPIGALTGSLIFLIILSAFFSASETAMMAINRYRLKHLAEAGHRGAKYARKLLENPHQLLGTILLGNNAANLTASAVATILALRVFGDIPIALITFGLTLIVLIFAEVAPKTVAALHPEWIAFPAAYVLYPLQKAVRPVVWVVNKASGCLLKPLVGDKKRAADALSAEELRVAVRESGKYIQKSHQNMLLQILELEKMSADDVMVPRSEIEAIDIDDDWDAIVNQLATSHHTRLPVYKGSLDNVIGILHLRKVLHLSQTNEFNRDGMMRIMRDPYFVPASSSLTQQLLNLQEERRRLGLVVDEYGDIKGLVTLEEILEEIVGEFTDHAPRLAEDVHAQPDGSFLIRGTANIRDLNRKMNWELPIDGPKTLNGLILEYLEHIPEPGTSIRLAGYPIEIVQTRGTAVTVAKMQLTDMLEEAPAAQALSGSQ